MLISLSNWSGCIERFAAPELHFKIRDIAVNIHILLDWLIRKRYAGLNMFTVIKHVNYISKFINPGV